MTAFDSQTRATGTPESRSDAELRAAAGAGSTLRGEVERVTYANAENGYSVLRVRDTATNVTVTATGHFVDIKPGELFQFTGTWSFHSQYGRQFKIDRALPVRPTSKPAMIRYLSSGLIKGIGEKTAERIVAHFGEDTFKILDENPACLMQVKSIAKKKAQVIVDAWQSQRAAADIMMFLNQHGITPNFARKIFKLYGASTIEIVSTDPYRLAEDLHGIGFLKADAIALNVGIAKDSPQRVRAAILYQLQQAEEKGHCYLTSPQLTAGLSATLDLPEAKLETRLEGELKSLQNSGAVITEKVYTQVGESAEGHYRGELLAAEADVADGIARLLGEPVDVDNERVANWVDRYVAASGTTLSDGQSQAVKFAVQSGVFVLTGGPGVGKTTTANVIIRLFKAMGKKVVLGAPTGRAAQRLSEVAAEKAKTIHRILEWAPAVGGFTRSAENPLDAQVVIIDEASMIDIRLMSNLVKALPTKCQLVLIGDVDQLPSVGPGNVLRDLIECRQVPFIKLDQIFRQASESHIVRTAHTINKGQEPEFALDQESPSDCQFIEVETSEDVLATVKKLVSSDIPERLGLDPVRDIQVLTPMNRGDLGTQTFNDELQRLLNPDNGPGQNSKRIFRRGDKVIQLVNNYDLGVFNGDIGFVREAGVEGGKVMVAFPDGRLVTYGNDEIGDLRLAYAITIHKSQGSEFPAVVIPVSMQHYIMLQRNLIYTGLTRARKFAIFVGSKRALAYAVRNQVSAKRQTQLIERLRRSLRMG
ncbi:ATP-dependent RecD-like DNA helicase [bacterium]|nr:ATP-dependent RecD-like DNA helicase [bacterium]